MGKVSELYIQIEEELTKGQLPAIIAQELEVPINWVYEVQADLYAELPDIEVPTDEEIDKMADYYNYGKDIGCEFDI